MNVHLTRELLRFIRDQVSSGRYGSANEVIHAGLRLLEKEDDWKVEVKKAVDEGVADIEAGRVRDGERAIRTLRRNLKSRA